MGPEAEGGDEGDPGPERHQLFDGFGVVDGHDRFKGVGGKIFFQQISLDDLSCPGARFPSNEGNLSECVERDRPGRWEKGMLEGVDENEAVVIQELPVEGDPLSPCRLPFYQPQIDFRGFEVMENLVGVGDGQTRGNPGVRPKKLREKGRQEVCSDGHGGPDPEMALRRVLEWANHLPGFLHLLDDRSGQRKELSAGLRQEDLLSRAFEEADLQIFFEGFDLKAHRRLG